MNSSYNFFSTLPPIPQPIKRKVFVSYHHANDQYWYNSFSQTFATQLDLLHDNSLDRSIDSTNAQYLNSTIREDHIKGTSLTIVLIGTETWKRRWVDWEIHATLEDEHALLGIALPQGYHNIGDQGKVIVPDRFFDNHTSGYAHFIHWPMNASNLIQAIEYAISLSANKQLIANSRSKLLRSHP